jgi:hypothetical protein
MKTQREPQGEHFRYLLPPCDLSFTIKQQHKNRCILEVSAYSGNHCFIRRELEVHYDHFGEIPVVVLDSCMRWLLWFAQFEAERRQLDPSKPKSSPLQIPQWPSRRSEVIDTEQLQF